MTLCYSKLCQECVAAGHACSGLKGIKIPFAKNIKPIDVGDELVLFKQETAKDPQVTPLTKL